MNYSREIMRKIYYTPLEVLANRLSLELEKPDRKGAMKIKHSGGIFIYKNSGIFYDFTSDSKGNVVDFMRKFSNYDSFYDIAKFILGDELLNEKEYYATTNYKKEDKKLDFKVPKKDVNMKRTFGYLVHSRKIDKDIIRYFIDKKILDSFIEETDNHRIFHYAGFLGRDDKGNIKRVLLDNSSSGYSFKKEVYGSDKKWGIHLKGSEDSKTLVVYESPIDMMSHMSILKKCENLRNHHRMAMGGLIRESLDNFLKNYPKIEHIFICTDDDSFKKTKAKINKGRVWAFKIKDEYIKKGYKITINKPYTKDYNDDLKLIENNKLNLDKWVKYQKDEMEIHSLDSQITKDVIDKEL